MNNNNPIKDIPYEDLKEYCKELGYYLSKKPEKLIPLEKCLCGRHPSHRWTLTEDWYTCPACGTKGPILSRKLPYTSVQAIFRTAHENDNVARKAWNNMIREKKEELK